MVRLRGRNFEVIKQDIPGIQFTGGYSTDRQMPVEMKCLKNGTISYSGNAKSFDDFTTSIFIDEVSQILRVDLSSDIDIGVFSTSDEAEYVRYLKDDTYSLGYYFASKIELPTKIYGPPDPGTGIGVLTGYGQTEYNTSLADFRDVCGDQYIQQITEGGAIIASLRLDFESKYQKSVFIEHTHESFLGIETASKTIEQIAIDYNLNGTLDFSAIQIGGDVGEIAEIFNASKSRYYINSCAIKNLTSCNEIIGGLLSYSDDLFQHQINYTDGVVTGSPTIMSFDAVNYTTLLLNMSDSVITSEIESARATLAESFWNQTEAQKVYTHVVDSSVGKRLPYYNASKEYMENLEANLELFTLDNNQAPLGCFYTPTNCPNVTETIMGELKPYNMSLVNDITNSTGYIYQIDWLMKKFCGGDLGIPGCGSHTSSNNVTLVPTGSVVDLGYKEYIIREDTSNTSKMFLYKGVNDLLVNFESSEVDLMSNCNIETIRDFPSLDYGYSSNEVQFAYEYSPGYERDICTRVFGNTHCLFQYFGGDECWDLAKSDSYCPRFEHADTYGCQGNVTFTEIDNPI